MNVLKIKLTDEKLREIFNLMPKDALIDALIERVQEIREEIQARKVDDDSLVKFEMKASILGPEAYSHPNIKTNYNKQ